MRIVHPATTATLALLVACGWAFSLATESAGTRYHDRCSTCHDRDAAAPGDEALPRGEACVRCHADPGHGIDARGVARQAGHAAVEMFEEAGRSAWQDQRCLSCHDPHASRSAALLRIEDDAAFTGPEGGPLDEGSRLCLQCHPTHADWGQAPGYRRHPVGLKVDVERMQEGADRPELPLSRVRAGGGHDHRVISCGTCHDVHASTHQNLLRWTEDRFVAACTTCHPKDRGDRPEPRFTRLTRSR